MRITTAPWIIPFTVAYFEACGRYNLTPDDQAMLVMAQLAMRVETP